MRVFARQQEAVAALGLRALASNTHLDDLLQEAVELVVRELDTECGDVLELLPRRNAFLLRAGVGWEAERVGRMTLPSGMDSHAGYALLINETLRIDDLDRAIVNRLHEEGRRRITTADVDAVGRPEDP